MCQACPVCTILILFLLTSILYSICVGLFFKLTCPAAALFCLFSRLALSGVLLTTCRDLHVLCVLCFSYMGCSRGEGPQAVLL